MKNRQLIRPTFFAALMLLATPSGYATPAEALPQLVEQWLNLSRQQQQLVTQWAQEKPALEQQLQLLKQEQQQLSGKVKVQQGGQSEVDSKRQSLITEQQQLEQQQQLLSSELIKHRQQLQQLASRMPPPLQASWQANLQTWQSSMEQLALAEQLQQVLAMYQQFRDFQKRIVVQQDVIELDGKQILVEQLYMGVSQAWFMTKDGSQIGIGAPKGTSWQWQQRDDIDVGALQQALAMYRKQQPAALVTLPYFALSRGAQ
ncbi:DUF3450 family protein [Pseudoalteromonas fenneropenaei]|uniref:DUF3450 family protein n=1 Tax=Pseudoalteromonas fenneropenaei TaxID=1737459 RepID=A0ABV7CGF3_9GAMM